MRACRVRILMSVRARRRLACASTSRVRGRRVCAFTSVHCIDISCACAAVVCARSRACVALMSRVRAR